MLCGDDRVDELGSNDPFAGVYSVLGPRYIQRGS